MLAKLFGIVVGAGVLGCAVDAPEHLGSTEAMSFEELKARVSVEPETGYYIVDWDRVVRSDDEGAYQPTLDPALDLALRLDAAVRRARPDAWRGVQAKEQVIKAALFEELRDAAEVERLFPIIKAQTEY